MTIQDYVNEIQAAIINEGPDMYKDPKYIPTISFKEGKKYYKVLYHANPSTSISVHCFVEVATGNIFKAAGWNAPAKGIRGNISNEKKPLLSGQFYNYR